MSQGIAIPIRTVAGRIALEEGAPQMGKVIMIALSDRASSNPFLADTVGIDPPVFDLNDDDARALMRHEIETHFRRWQSERRARLISLNFRQQGGELSAVIRYIDLETDEEVEIEKRGRRV